MNPIPNHWLISIPGREPIASPVRIRAGFRNNCVRVSAGTSQYLMPVVSEWWIFSVSAKDIEGLEFPTLAIMTKPAELVFAASPHQTVAIVGKPHNLALRVVDATTWDRTGRTCDWPPLAIPIPEDWPIFGVRAAGEKAPEVVESFVELMGRLRREMGDLPRARFDSEGGVR